MTAVVTTAGAALIAAATAGDPLELTQIAVGDGNGAAITPAVGMTALVNERARVDISDMVSVANVSRFRAIFTPGPTGYTMREAGLFAGSTLVAIMSLSPQDMPTQAWATANNQVIETAVTIALVVTDADTVSINIEGSGYATIEYVNSRVPAFATLQEHREGSTNSKIVVPGHNKTVLDEHRASRTEHPTGTKSLQGFLRLATVAESRAMALADVAVPPDGLGAAILDLLGGVGIAGNTLKKLYDLITALQGADTTIINYLANLATFASMPVYPEFINNTAAPGTEDVYKIIPTRAGNELVIPTGKVIVHRGGKIYGTSSFSAAQLKFPVANNKYYHLRWYAPGHANAPLPTWPNGRFMLRDLADGTYNPAAQPAYGRQFDTKYDDANVAEVQVGSLGETTITPLINKAFFDQMFMGGGAPNAPGYRDDNVPLGFGRCPTVHISPLSYTTGVAAAPGIPEFEIKVNTVNRLATNVSFAMAKGTDLQWQLQVTLNSLDFNL